MSTKSRARARRRHSELEDKNALGAVGASILNVVTLGMLEPDTEIALSQPAPTSASSDESARP